ncbi:MAG TPA: hypothetical protein VF283_07900 [Bryobacteraceae bacterium]
MTFWRYLAILFFLGAIAVLPVWPYTAGWTGWPAAFLFFITVLLLIMAVVSRRGSSMWHTGGQRPPHN